MASKHCYKPANETCQQKCLEKCYGHGKPNDTGSYYSGQSLGSNVNSALYGQTYHCPDRNMASKPNMNSSYGYQIMTDQYHPVAKPCPTQTPVAHGQCNQGHGHSHVGKQCGTSHGKMASCHGKSHEKKKADHCNNKKDKSHKMKNKHKDCNRSCSDSSDSSSDSDCN
ncbi:hypothetical protein TorRG33x02_216970 [Trema orientale]|uniref:Uncharacterized protein n=1 Tax=Trema orientale TaxID=63057 RepID=A0A2P5EA68_TREOI|nr:hypothetical protein TorRG33x02_216970 [Trema orientale]